MSGIHRRRPRPLKTRISRPARRSSRQRVIRPRSSLLSARRQPKVVSLSVSEAGNSGRRIMRNELNSPASADEIDDAEEIGDDLEEHHQVRSEGEAPDQEPEEVPKPSMTPRLPPSGS